MKKSTFIIVLSLLVTSISVLTYWYWPTKTKTLTAATPSGSPATLLVKFNTAIVDKNQAIITTPQITNSSLQELLLTYEVTTLPTALPNRYDENGVAKNYTASNSLTMELWRKITLPSKQQAVELLTRLRAFDFIEKGVMERVISLSPDIDPNDPDFTNRRQWHLDNPANPNFDIDAPDAWDINRGRNDVIVAVLDGGVDYNHPDLDPGNRSRVIAGTDTGDNDSDPMDDIALSAAFANHGTPIAGIIGARTDNGQQVAGIMWNCQIMPIKIVNTYSVPLPIPHLDDWEFNLGAQPSDVADAIDYAVNNGANVINLSYSFPDLGWAINEVALRVPLLRDAMENAYQNNVVITASMGNSFADNNDVRYPAGFNDQVIAVGATNQNGTRRPSSNTGPHIDLAAPGTGIWTTSRGGGTDNPSGTSFSAPIVAGVAGLIFSQGLDRGFNLTNDDVRHIMELTATDVVIYGTGFDNDTGHGIVNAHHALQLLNEPNTVVHGTSMGGTAVKVVDETVYGLLDNRWGVAAGYYYQSDIYRITKHVTFDIPFCDTPEVWMRERQSKAISGDNPTLARPFAEITNITATGFDVEYAAAYLKYNSSAQEVKKWIPAAPQSTVLAYTAVGELNEAATAGNITGSSTVCASNTTFTLQNRPTGSTVSWSKSSNLTYVSGQGTSNYRVRANSSSTRGTGWVRAAITTECGPVTRQKDFWVGKPNAPQLASALGTICKEEIVSLLAEASSSAEVTTGYTYEWQFTGNTPTVINQSTNMSSIEFYYCSNGFSTINVTATNSCGTSSSTSTTVNVNGVCTIGGSGGGLGGNGNQVVNCSGSGGPDPGDGDGSGGGGDLPDPSDDPDPDPGDGGVGILPPSMASTGGSSIYTDDLGTAIHYYPNAATDDVIYVDFSISTEAETKYSKESIDPYSYNIRLINRNGRCVWKGTTTEKKNILNIGDVQPGNYILEIVKEDQKMKRYFKRHMIIQ